jgi:Holliday junction resolvase RusA-like endonuclease
MPTVTMRLDAIPSGQGRARVASRGKFATVYKAAGDRDNEATIAALAAAHRPASPIAGPVSINFVAVMPRPKSMCGVSKRTGLPLKAPDTYLHTGKPDLDNLAKALLDALKGWWLDDAQVCDLQASKAVAAFGEQPHWMVRVAWHL